MTKIVEIPENNITLEYLEKPKLLYLYNFIVPKKILENLDTTKEDFLFDCKPTLKREGVVFDEREIKSIIREYEKCILPNKESIFEFFDEGFTVIYSYYYQKISIYDFLLPNEIIDSWELNCEKYKIDIFRGLFEPVGYYAIEPKNLSRENIKEIIRKEFK